MDDPVQYVTTFVGAVSLMMSLVLLISLVHRTARLDRTNTLMMGALVALTVIYTMSDPIQLERGQYDMRFLLIGAAMALLGPTVGVMALITGLSYRFYIGGPGVTVGVIGMCLSFFGGFLWWMFIRDRAWSFFQKSLSLGLLIALHIFSLFAASPENIPILFSHLAPYMIVTSLVGAFMMNYLIKGELSFLSEARATRIEATTDHLTGLLNRRGLDLSYPMCSAPDGDRLTGVSVLYFDVDKFKEVNDAHGHAVGDCILRRVSTRVASNLRPNDIFARLGGDEFVIILRNVEPKEAKNIAERCRALVEKRQFIVNELHVDISISIGAIWSYDRMELEQVLEKADEALYSAKNAGRNRVVFTSEDYDKMISTPSLAA